MHQCRASEVLVIGGNRSGKSLSTFVEDARAATGQDPYGKYPEKDGILCIIGANWKHIGLVAYPMLFKSGAFKIIRDEVTQQWRAYNPETDYARKAECKPAPPLIPPRLVKHTSWVLKSAGYCNSVELHNGWQVLFFSSEGDPPQGFQSDRVHIDEDVSNEQWVPEMQARLSDRKGRFCWSAMPHSKNDALLGLSERADIAEQAGVENPIIKKFVLRYLDNPHIDNEEKRKNIERWSALGEDVVRMRAEGEFVTDSVLVYPTFHMSIHGFERSQLPNGVTIPDEWTRYAAVDPGHAVTSVLFAAVPPDGDMLLIYDELYLRQCNATIFGEKFAAACASQPQLYAYIIDMHGGRIRDIGSGRQVVEQYCEQLRHRNTRSITTGSAFIAGCDDVLARTSAVRGWMHIRPNGTPKLRILRGTCPNLERELRRYRKKVVLQNGLSIVTDEPNTRGEVHACQCLEYLVAYEPKFHARKQKVDETAGMPQWMIEYLARKQARLGKQHFVYLGPESDLSSTEVFDGNVL
jgi:hypothetical protein